MALINCRECGKEISNEATSCPYCGCPVNEQKDMYVNNTVNENVLKNKKQFKKITDCGAGCLIIVILCVAFIFYVFKYRKSKE